MRDSKTNLAQAKIKPHNPPGPDGRCFGPILRRRLDPSMRKLKNPEPPLAKEFEPAKEAPEGRPRTPRLQAESMSVCRIHIALRRKNPRLKQKPGQRQIRTQQHPRSKWESKV